MIQNYQYILWFQYKTSIHRDCNDDNTMYKLYRVDQRFRLNLGKRCLEVRNVFGKWGRQKLAQTLNQTDLIDSKFPIQTVEQEFSKKRHDQVIIKNYDLL